MAMYLQEIDFSVKCFKNKHKKVLNGININEAEK